MFVAFHSQCLCRWIAAKKAQVGQTPTCPNCREEIDVFASDAVQRRYKHVKNLRREANKQRQKETLVFIDDSYLLECRSVQKL